MSREGLHGLTLPLTLNPFYMFMLSSRIVVELNLYHVLFLRRFVGFVGSYWSSLGQCDLPWIERYCTVTQDHPAGQLLEPGGLFSSVGKEERGCTGLIEIRSGRSE